MSIDILLQKLSNKEVFYTESLKYTQDLATLLTARHAAIRVRLAPFVFFKLTTIVVSDISRIVPFMFEIQENIPRIVSLYHPRKNIITYIRYFRNCSFYVRNSRKCTSHSFSKNNQFSIRKLWYYSIIYQK